MKRTISRQAIDSFSRFLRLEEKSPHTIEKYLRDVKAFTAYLGENELTKEAVLNYKEHLIREGYAVVSINSMLASINSFMRFLGYEDCRVCHIRTQRKIYCMKEKELTRSEYLRLLKAASSRPRLYMIIETICATGIRVSELKYFTLEAVRSGEVVVSCKNKTRSILLPAKLRTQLLKYARDRGIETGILFCTRHGNPVDRSNIWLAMKRLCRAARVQSSKVFPHNLRKLFARAFYNLDKDIAKLADLLGHSSINTTRIYIMTTSKEYQKKINQLGLVV